MLCRVGYLLQRTGKSFILIISLALGACSLSPSTTSGQSLVLNVTGTATPAVAPGNYVFIREGNLWARTKYGFATAITSFHIGLTPNTWGDFAWSADDAKLAFVLRAPAIAPGNATGQPEQQTGTLFIADIASHNVTPIGIPTGLQLPLIGHHVIWLPDNSLLVSTQGAIFHIIPAITPTIMPIEGPQHVWDISLANNTVVYSTVAGIQKNGVAQTQIRSFHLDDPHKTDTLLATPGPTVLPPGQCGVLICPPDLTTPYVPYSWAISKDGTMLAYQRTATIIANGIVPQIADLLAQSTFDLMTVDAQKQTAILQGIQVPSIQTTLQFSPDGTSLVLAPATIGTTYYAPDMVNIAANGTASQPSIIRPPDTLSTTVAFNGPISWSPDGTSFAMTVTTASQRSFAVSYTQAGQGAILESDASQIFWAS